MPSGLICFCISRGSIRPRGRAMFQMLGVFAGFERAMIRERVMAGLARARAEGKQLGRRTVEQSHAKKVRAALALRSKGIGIRRIAKEVAWRRNSGPVGQQRRRCEARVTGKGPLFICLPRGFFQISDFKKTE
jgi:DNA invertase Pin-like site-specific DNA recombinase